jgi:hypothetical protein
MELVTCFPISRVHVHLLRHNRAWDDKVLRAVLSFEVDEYVNVRWRIDLVGLVSNQPIALSLPLRFDLN